VNTKEHSTSLGKVTTKDWLLTVLSALLTIAAGVNILVTGFNESIVPLVMCGSCLVLFSSLIIRKKRYQRIRLISAQVAGGTPIRQSRSKVIFVALFLMIVGSIFVIYGQYLGKAFQLISFIGVITGIVLTIAIVAEFFPVTYVQFDPEGFTFGQSKWKVTLPWSSISNMVQAELHQNPAIFLWVTDYQELIVVPDAYREKALKQVAYLRKWVGTDFVIMPYQYNIDNPIFFAAMNRYISTPSARAELNNQPKIEHA